MTGERRPLLVLVWVLLVSAASGLAVVWMLAQGTKGNEIAEAVGAVCGIVAGVFAVLTYFQGSRPVSSGPAVRRHRPRWIALGLAAALLAGGATWLGWSWADRDNLNVTADMTPGIVRPLADSGELRLTVPGRPPERRRLALTLTLENAGTVGNCVRPARLELTPVLDGESGTPVVASSGEEVELPAAATRTAEVKVRLKHPDPECGLFVRVSRAILFN